jgi:uncharacterized membrane protein YphA (DoxX/SURF4 family)
MFIYGGIDALKDPEGKAKAVDDVAPMIAEALGLPTTDTVTLVRVNGAVHVIAGSLLAIGKCRRLAALTLAASLVPTTYAAHRFWDEMDDEQRARQRIQFLKNASMLGGLILAAADTGGRPSVPWQARRAAKQAVEATVAAGAATQDAAKHLLGSTGPAKDVAGGLGDAASRAAATAKDAAGGLGDAASRAATTAKGAAGAGATLAAALAKQISDAAEDVDLKAEWQKVSRRAAKAAEKAQKSELTKRARKAAAKAAKNAQKLELSKRARKASQKAMTVVQQAELADRASAAAGLAAQKLRDALPLAS